MTLNQIYGITEEDYDEIADALAKLDRVSDVPPPEPTDDGYEIVEEYIDDDFDWLDRFYLESELGPGR